MTRGDENAFLRFGFKVPAKRDFGAKSFLPGNFLRRVFRLSGGRDQKNGTEDEKGFHGTKIESVSNSPAAIQGFAVFTFPQTAKAVSQETSCLGAMKTDSQVLPLSALRLMS